MTLRRSPMVQPQMSLIQRAVRQNFPASRTFSNALARFESTTASTAVASEANSSSSQQVTTTTPPKEAITADVISGAPGELRHRAVRIFLPTPSTMQSGTARSQRWRLDWDVLQGGGRWENPLMGWASSADYMQGTRLSFRTKEDAIHFAEKQGWDYYVQQEPVRRIPPKNYAENFLYRPKPLRIIKTK